MYIIMMFVINIIFTETVVSTGFTSNVSTYQKRNCITMPECSKTGSACIAWPQCFILHCNEYNSDINNLYIIFIRMNHITGHVIIRNMNRKTFP